MMIGVLFGNFCSSCFIKISVSFYVKITFFPDFFDDLTPVAMGSYYQCSNPDSNEKNWTGHIRPLNINRNEFEVTARGSTFHLLVGKHAYGKYLCIPNWGIGTEISSLSDCFWNRERLEQDYPELSKVDIISIVKALEALSSYVTLSMKQIIRQEICRIAQNATDTKHSRLWHGSQSD